MALLRRFRARLFPEIRPAFNRLPRTLSLFCVILVCLGTFLIREKGLWRNIFLYGVLAVLGALFYRNSVYNIDHLFGYLIGLGSGAIMVWSGKRKLAR